MSSLFKLAYNGFSVISMLMIFLLGVTLRIIISLDNLELTVKMLLLTLLFLMALLIFTFEQDQKMLKESMKE